MPDYADPDTKHIHEYEDIKLVYEAISWTGLTKENGGLVSPQPAKGKFLVDWIREGARVHAAKFLAQLITGKSE